jgi:hypothetical protein
MKLGTLISVSGAIDFPQEIKFHEIQRSQPPQGESEVSFKPSRPNRFHESPEPDRFARICRWIIVALLSLAAVA